MKSAGGKLKIVVIGEGVRPDTSSEHRIYPINRAEGFSMRQGVEWALADPAVRRISNLVQFVFEDDFGSPDDAARVARKYQTDASTLLVIGHASSGTTRAALPIYEAANIPVLMPIATSPSVAGRTAFRLPLNDRVGQAPALFHLLRDHLKRTRIFIVKDVGSDATFYTDSLEASFRRLLPSSMFRGYRNVSATDTVFAEVANAARGEKADAIVFIGYGSTAARLLDALNDAFQVDPTAAPVVVLSDGCINPDLRTGILHVYLTAPMPDLRQTTAAVAALEHQDSGCDGDTANRLRRHLDDQSIPNYHVFGYDAALIAASAVSQCSAKGSAVSRACVAQTIAQSRDLGACTEYIFRGGENVNGAYYAYTITSTADRLQLTPFRGFEARTLAEAANAGE